MQTAIRARAPQEADLGAVHHLGAGYVAGAMMVLVTNPVWMIKTRMQLQDKKAKSGGVRPYSGLMGVCLRASSIQRCVELYFLEGASVNPVRHLQHRED